MVPHGQVEEALHQAAGAETQVFAVTGIPDERKGEQLAVLHTLDESQIPDIVASSRQTDSRICLCPHAPISSKSTPCRSWARGKWICEALKRIAMERLGK